MTSLILVQNTKAGQRGIQYLPLINILDINVTCKSRWSRNALLVLKYAYINGSKSSQFKYPKDFIAVSKRRNLVPDNGYCLNLWSLVTMTDFSRQI